MGSEGKSEDFWRLKSILIIALDEALKAALVKFKELESQQLGSLEV